MVFLILPRHEIETRNSCSTGQEDDQLLSCGSSLAPSMITQHHYYVRTEKIILQPKDTIKEEGKRQKRVLIQDFVLFPLFLQMNFNKEKSKFLYGLEINFYGTIRNKNSKNAITFIRRSFEYYNFFFSFT